MSSLSQQQWQPQMLPADRSAQNTSPGQSGCLNEPQSTSSVEAQMSQQALEKIQDRLAMAKFFQKYRVQLIPNQYGVTVTSNPVSSEEKICVTVNMKKKIVPLTVKNSGVTTLYLTLRAIDLVKDIFTVRDCHGKDIKSLRKHTLRPGDEYKIEVHFCSHHAGFYEQLLVFSFETCQQSSDRFEIMRLLEVVHRTSFCDAPLPKATDPAVTWIPDERVTLPLPRPVVPLKGHGMPDSIKDRKKSKSVLQRPLNRKNYVQRFHLLLHHEEQQQTTETEKYKQDNVPMFRHKSNASLYILQMAGVSRSSSVNLSGTQVLVSPSDPTNVIARCCKAWVHHVDAQTVYLKLTNDEFSSHFKDGMRFRVIFSVNRIPLRIQHRAVSLAKKLILTTVLFPNGKHSSHLSHLQTLTDLECNPEQRVAIQHIVANSAKPAPYLVFGPPGTGKTMTLVRAIRQIVETTASCKILACAPSNSAADHLCGKILEWAKGTHSVHRLYALSWPVRNIPDVVKESCNLDIETNTLMIPQKTLLMSCKILVTTLINVGRLVTGGIRPGHYTYIFVDEAGQATEPESIIPITGLLKPHKCQVVLAGDPKQLGPIIMSRMAKKHGLGVSLLERLMGDIDLYKAHETYGFNNRFVTKLLRNYRSHPAILKNPNELFYKGELQPYGPKEICSKYCKWEKLPKKGFPLIFHGVAGTNERDGDNPSIYNMAEVEVVMEYLKALVDHLHKNGDNIQPGEIGIIAPYRKQVEKIQKALQMDDELRGKKLENVLVGTVEKFQGKESNAILVSTARSTSKLTEHTQQFTLGFVADEKRFNVALTRARALLIVIGDPRVLKTDHIWNKFIHYCYKEGAYRGIIVSDADEEEEEDILTPKTSVESDSATDGLCGRNQQTHHTNLPLMNIEM